MVGRGGRGELNDQVQNTNHWHLQSSLICGHIVLQFDNYNIVYDLINKLDIIQLINHHNYHRIT